MRTKICVMGIVGCCALLALAASGASPARAADKGSEKQVDIKDVPAAARAALEKEVGEGTITGVFEGSDAEGGKPSYYEAKYTLADKKLAVRVTPEGKLISKGDDAG